MANLKIFTVAYIKWNNDKSTSALAWHYMIRNKINMALKCLPNFNKMLRFIVKKKYLPYFFVKPVELNKYKMICLDRKIISESWKKSQVMIWKGFKYLLRQDIGFT